MDIPFPKKVRDEIIAAGRAEPHHVLPDSGWVSFYLNESADVEKAIGLFRQSFELARSNSRTDMHGNKTTRRTTWNA
ncbi:MAG: luciferase family protein [bacterium]